MDQLGKTDVSKLAWFGDLFLEGEIQGVVLWFHGLNGLCRTARNQISAWEAEVAARGGLVVYPYYNPWSFLCRNDLAFIDRLIPEVYRKFGLKKSVPLVSAGQSMGGAAALLYCRYGQWRPVACAALSPLCDPEDFYASCSPQRPTGAAAMHNMFDPEPEGFEAALIEHSPLRQAAAMPDIPYLLIHSEMDEVVPKRYSDRMAEALRRAGRQVTYREQKYFGHTAVSVRDEIAMADFVSETWSYPVSEKPAFESSKGEMEK